MKKAVFFLMILLFAIPGFSQESDKVTGIWWNGDKTTKLKVEKKGGEYIGTIVFISPEKYKNGQPPKDDKNPDKSMHNRSLIGLQILSGLEYDAKAKEWKNGSIYDPKSGKTYDCFVRMDDNNVMKMKGFVAGIRMLGRTEDWSRTEL